MKTIRRVALYGKGLVLASVGATLQGREGVETTQVDPLAHDALRRLADALPHAILFDLAANKLDFAVDLLRQHPGLLLIGVDLGRDTMLVMSAKAVRLLTIDDLLRFIDGG